MARKKRTARKKRNETGNGANLGFESKLWAAAGEIQERIGNIAIFGHARPRSPTVREFTGTPSYRGIPASGVQQRNTEFRTPWS